MDEGILQRLPNGITPAPEPRAAQAGLRGAAGIFALRKLTLISGIILSLTIKQWQLLHCILRKVVRKT
jgi:hypothetical protein